MERKEGVGDGEEAVEAEDADRDEGEDGDCDLDACRGPSVSCPCLRRVLRPRWRRFPPVRTRMPSVSENLNLRRLDARRLLGKCWHEKRIWPHPHIEEDKPRNE